MKQVCSHCHTPDYINQFYRHDDLAIHFNEFAKLRQAIMSALAETSLISKTQMTTISNGPGTTSGTTRAAARAWARR
jgi:hypothetical protein